MNAPHGHDRLPNGAGRAPWQLAVLILVTLVIRLVNLDQPIVENYVGRQIPTAMVARNLERGSGFLRPRLDTAPYPNYFLVEPPLYELGVIALKWIAGLRLEPAGRAFSALATLGAAWGLYELMEPRGGRRAALFAIGAFALLPITIRYGRAFQPDLAMLGASVSGLACWDRYEFSKQRSWLLAAWILLALGFAIKISGAFLLAPLAFEVIRGYRKTAITLAFSTLLPALLWYAWANYLVRDGSGSLASADNRAIWLGLIGPAALAHRQTWEHIFRFLCIRAFTPLGVILALSGFLYAGGLRFGRRIESANANGFGADFTPIRLWIIWSAVAGFTLATLAQKLHHEYYFLILAPVVAVGIGYALDGLAKINWQCAYGTFCLLGMICLLQARSTWQTPNAWAGLSEASRIVARETSADARIVAPEALLYQADRRGCRLEWTPSSVRRAAGEWGVKTDLQDPLDLVEYYRLQGARYFADLGNAWDDTGRMALHEGVRRRYKVIVDRPEVIIADLVVVEMHPNAH